LLTLVASAIGLVAAVALTRFMASMLFNVAPRDPITFALVAAVLAMVSIAATLIPAHRAMRIDPTIALKQS
jgi:ABC-type antimicrobial peptide transport system permease subunit